MHTEKPSPRGEGVAGRLRHTATDEGLTFLKCHSAKSGYLFRKNTLGEFMKDRLTGFSQELRRNMTKEEKHLWYDFLKQLPITVQRQKVIGDYIVDFYISDSRLVIELDGSQHYSEKGEEKDHIRDRYFQKIGITVLRYTNLDIKKNFQGVCSDILYHIGKDVFSKDKEK